MYAEATGMQEGMIREVPHLTRSPFLLKFSSEAAKLVNIWENCQLDLFYQTIRFLTLPW